MTPLLFFIGLVAVSALMLFAYATIATIVVDTKAGVVAFTILCGMAIVHAIGMGAVVSLIGGPTWLTYWWWVLLYFVGSIIVIMVA